MIDIPANVVVHPLLIEKRVAHIYCCLINDLGFDDNCGDIMAFIGLLNLTYIMRLH